MTKSYSLQEGMQLLLQYANEPTEKGITIMIGATDVEDMRKRLEEHTYEVIENSEEVIEKLQASQEKIIFLDKREYKDRLSLENRHATIRRTAKKQGVNVYILVELSNRSENRYADINDFHFLNVQIPDMMFGVTNAGINQMKTRFGHKGIVA